MPVKITQIKETCLYINNLERTKEFYHYKLGLPIISYVEDRHIFFRAGSSVLLCFIATTTKEEEKLPRHFGEGELHFAFAIAPEEYNTAKEHIQQQEIEIEHEEDWGNGFLSFYFRDPDRNAVEIVMEGMWDKN